MGDLEDKLETYTQECMKQTNLTEPELKKFFEAYLSTVFLDTGKTEKFVRYCKRYSKYEKELTDYTTKCLALFGVDLKAVVIEKPDGIDVKVAQFDEWITSISEKPFSAEINPVLEQIQKVDWRQTKLAEKVVEINGVYVQKQLLYGVDILNHIKRKEPVSIQQLLPLYTLGSDYLDGLVKMVETEDERIHLLTRELILDSLNFITSKIEAYYRFMVEHFKDIPNEQLERLYTHSMSTKATLASLLAEYTMTPLTVASQKEAIVQKGLVVILRKDYDKVMAMEKRWIRALNPGDSQAIQAIDEYFNGEELDDFALISLILMSLGHLEGDLDVVVPVRRSAPAGEGEEPLVTEGIPVAEGTEKPTEKAESKDQGKPAEKSESKDQSKPVEKAPVKEDKDMDKPAENAMDKPSEKMTRTWGNTVEQLFGRFEPAIAKKEPTREIERERETDQGGKEAVFFSSALDRLKGLFGQNEEMIPTTRDARRELMLSKQENMGRRLKEKKIQWKDGTVKTKKHEVQDREVKPKPVERQAAEVKPKPVESQDGTGKPNAVEKIKEGLRLDQAGRVVERGRELAMQAEEQIVPTPEVAPPPTPAPEVARAATARAAAAPVVQTTPEVIQEGPQEANRISRVSGSGEIQPSTGDEARQNYSPVPATEPQSEAVRQAEALEAEATSQENESKAVAVQEAAEAAPTAVSQLASPAASPETQVAVQAEVAQEAEEAAPAQKFPIPQVVYRSQQPKRNQSQDNQPVSKRLFPRTRSASATPRPPPPPDTEPAYIVSGLTEQLPPVRLPIQPVIPQPITPPTTKDTKNINKMGENGNKTKGYGLIRRLKQLRSYEPLNDHTSVTEKDIEVFLTGDTPYVAPIPRALFRKQIPNFLERIKSQGNPFNSSSRHRRRSYSFFGNHYEPLEKEFTRKDNRYEAHENQPSTLSSVREPLPHNHVNQSIEEFNFSNENGPNRKQALNDVLRAAQVNEIPITSGSNDLVSQVLKAAENARSYSETRRFLNEEHKKSEAKIEQEQNEKEKEQAEGISQSIDGEITPVMRLALALRRAKPTPRPIVPTTKEITYSDSRLPLNREDLEAYLSEPTEEDLLRAYKTSRDDVTKLTSIKQQIEELETHTHTSQQMLEAKQRLKEASKAADLSEFKRFEILAKINQKYKTSINQFIDLSNQELANFTKQLDPLLDIFYSSQPRIMDPKQYVYTIPSLVNFPVNNVKVDSTTETLCYYIKHYDAVILYMRMIIELYKKLDELVKDRTETEIYEYSNKSVKFIQRAITSMNDHMMLQLKPDEPCKKKDVSSLIRQIKDKKGILNGLMEEFKELNISPWEQIIIDRFKIKTQTMTKGVQLLQNTGVGREQHGGVQGVFRTFQSLKELNNVFMRSSISRGASINRPPRPGPPTSFRSTSIDTEQPPPPPPRKPPPTPLRRSKTEKQTSIEPETEVISPIRYTVGTTVGLRRLAEQYINPTHNRSHSRRRSSQYNVRNTPM